MNSPALSSARTWRQSHVLHQLSLQVGQLGWHPGKVAPQPHVVGVLCRCMTLASLHSNWQISQAKGPEIQISSPSRREAAGGCRRMPKSCLKRLNQHGWICGSGVKTPPTQISSSRRETAGGVGGSESIGEDVGGGDGGREAAGGVGGSEAIGSTAQARKRSGPGIAL